MCRRVTCAQLGEAGPSSGDAGCFLPHHGRSPRRIPRCSRSFVRSRPRVPGLSRPAPGPRNRRRAPRRAPEDVCAAAGPLESCGAPLACSLGAIWLHVLVTHQEGCSPRGSRRTHTASARPAQPPRAQPTALRPGPGPPSARPSPAPPPAETPAPAHNPGGKTLEWVGVSLSRTTRGRGSGPPDSTVSSAFHPVTQPFLPPEPQ